MFNLIMLFYLLVAVFSNEFLKLSLVGVPSVPLLFLMGINAIYLIFNWDKKLFFNKRRLLMIPIFLFIISILYIVLSYVGFIDWFGIEGFDLKKEHIYRQSYFVLCFPIAINIYNHIIKSKDVLSLFNRFAYPVIILLVVVKLINHYDDRTVIVLVSSIALYIFLFKNKGFGLGAVAAIIFFWWGTEGITGKFIMLSLLFYMFSEVGYSRYVKKYKMVFIGSMVLFILFTDNIINILKVLDANSWWRLALWKHEWSILLKTVFLGVGFGTPYAANQIVSQLYFDPSIPDVLYITGQHSSFINMFYRLGLIGGSLFLYLNVLIIKYCDKLREMLSVKEQKIIQWAELSYLAATISIGFNVGLESPRVFISYLIFTPIIIGLLIKYNDKYKLATKNYVNYIGRKKGRR